MYCIKQCWIRSVDTYTRTPKSHSVVSSRYSKVFCLFAVIAAVSSRNASGRFLNVVQLIPLIGKGAC